MKKVSFDFDDTLAHKYVQKYAKKLIDKRVEVWIVTTRWENPNKYSFPATHDDLFGIANKLNIPNNHIHFNNMEYKHNFFEKNEDFIFHLDDNWKESYLINKLTSVVGITYDSNIGDIPEWMQKCNILLT